MARSIELRASSTLAPAALALAAAAAAFLTLVIVGEEPKLLALVVAASGLGVLLLRNPQWILPAFVAVTYASISDAFFGGLPSPVELGAGVLLVLAAYRAPRLPQLTRVVLIVTALIALPAAAVALLHPSSLPSLFDLLKRLAFLPVVALCIRDRGDVDRVFLALTITGLVLGLGAAQSVLIGPNPLFPVSVADSNEASRALGPFGEANFFAMSLSILIPFALYYVSRGGPARWLGYATVFAVTAGVLAAGSRAGLLAVLFATIVFAVVAGSRQIKLGAVVLVLAVALLIPLFAAQASSSAQRTVSGRATENLVAIAIFVDHPVVGVGPGEYPNLYRDYARYVGNDDRVLREPHSLPLQIAAEQGVVGVLAWLAAGLAVIRVGAGSGLWRSMRGKVLAVSLATFLFQSLFLHGGQLRIFFMMLGLTLVAAWLHVPRHARVLDERRRALVLDERRNG